MIAGGDDGTIKVWDAATGKERTTLTNPDAIILALQPSSGGKRLLSAGTDITVWDLATARKLRTLSRESDLKFAALSSDGKRVVSGWWDKSIVMWDASTGKELRRAEGYTSSQAFSRDGRLVLSGGCTENNGPNNACSKGAIKLWRASNWQMIHEFSAHEGNPFMVTFSRDGRFAVSCGTDNAIRVWDVSECAGK